MTDKTKEAFDIIEKGVMETFSSNNFKNYLKCLSHFHHYSANNILLILAQKPDATLVSGFSNWRTSFNRTVNKGERAIKILAPFEKSVEVLVNKKDEKGNEIRDSTGKNVREVQKRKVRMYKTANVFDISQTSGDPLPTLVTQLKGTTEEARALIDSIIEVSEIPVLFHNKETDWTLKMGANGYYDLSSEWIVVNEELDDIQKAKTLSHEYAHSVLHNDLSIESDQREIEAESVAFVICDHFGINTQGYSFGYVASYAAKEPEKLKEILSNIQSKAHEIISQIEPAFLQRMPDIKRLQVADSVIEKDEQEKER